MRLASRVLKEIAPQRQKFAVQNRPEPTAQGEAAINFLPT
jgi:hypothetical protein